MEFSAKAQHRRPPLLLCSFSPTRYLSRLVCFKRTLSFNPYRLTGFFYDSTTSIVIELAVGYPPTASPNLVNTNGPSGLYLWKEHQNKMTTYYSVDVETTGPIPRSYSLLSVGVQVVRDDATYNTGECFYRTIFHEQLLWDPGTKKWWDSQDQNIWRGSRQDSMEAARVAAEFESWVEEMEPDPSLRCFVANPVAFDWPWINDLFIVHRGKNPFGHRALCLRSMHFGLRDVTWNSERETWGEFQVTPDHPHHALSDAIAQAEELSRMLQARG